jgi:hypothetical protein
MVFLQTGLALCGNVPLDHFGVPRCSVTFTPLLMQVTYSCGKTLWLSAKKFSCGNNFVGEGGALAAVGQGTLGLK